ncbi:MAG: hypothetical protein Q7S09_02840 [bacterium]|nr:hypothetical protein [bacterium]
MTIFTILVFLFGLYVGGLAVYIIAIPHIAASLFTQGKPWPSGKRATVFYPFTLFLLWLSSNERRWKKIQTMAKS